MKRFCPICAPHRAWRLGDGRFRSRGWGHRYSFNSVRESCRLPQQARRQLLEYFVLGGPAYRLRFRCPASRPAIERYLD